MVKPIPDGYQTVTTTLVFKDARRAIDFYKKAFGAKEIRVTASPDGKNVLHGEIQIGTSMMMVGTESRESECRSAETVGQSTAAFALYVPNSDATFKQAVQAGGTVVKPVADMFWGDRGGSVKDPFGHNWWILTHTRDVSQKEIDDAVKEMVAEGAHP